MTIIFKNKEKTNYSKKSRIFVVITEKKNFFLRCIFTF